jgi:preprotein translocase subunit SecG
VLASLFFVSSLGLAYFGLQQHKPSASVLDRTAVPTTTAKPAEPAQAPEQNGSSKAGDIPQ